MSEQALAVGIVRGWGLEFDGTGDPKEFVSRIEDTAATYGIRLDHIAGAMQFLLKGNALNWWHANPIEMTDWITFKRQLNLHFVPDLRTGQLPNQRLLPWSRGNWRRPWETSQQSGDGMRTRSNKGLITSPEQLRTQQPPMMKPKLPTDCIRQQEDDMDLHPEESREEDHGAPMTNPSKETAEIPLAIQEEDQLSEEANQPTMNGPKLIGDGGTRQHESDIDIRPQESILKESSQGEEDLTDCPGQQEDPMALNGEGSSGEDHEVCLTNSSEETSEIPLAVQREARWRQAQKRPGLKVCFEMSADGQDYRIKISESGNINICQLKPEQVMDDDTEQPTMIRPQLLTDGGTPKQEEDHGVSLTNQRGETTDIPLIIKQEARWRLSHKQPGEQVCYTRSVEGKEYRVTMSRSGIVNICKLEPERVMDNEAEQRPTIRSQLLRDRWTPQQKDVDIHAKESWEEDRGDPSEETRDIPLIIQQEARWKLSHKRPGEQVCYTRSVEGKEYRVKMSRSGIVNICQLEPEHVMDNEAEQRLTIRPQLLRDRWTPQQNIHAKESWEEDRGDPSEETRDIPLIIQQEARWKLSHKRPGEQVCYTRSVGGKKYRVKMSRSGIVNICQLEPEHVMDNEAEQRPTIRAQLLRDHWTRQQEDVVDTYAEESWEEYRVDPSAETTDIPLVIQDEARLRRAHKRPGKQMCYKRTVEGKEYRVKIGRGGKMSIYQL